MLKYNEYYQNFTYNIKLLTRTVQFTPASYKYQFFWFKSNISTFQCNETRFFFSEQILHSISEVTWHISRYNMAHGAAPNSLHLFHSVQNMASCHKMYSGYKKVLEVACLKKKNKKNLENIVEKKNLLHTEVHEKRTQRIFPEIPRKKNILKITCTYFSMLTILDRRDDLFIRASSRKELSVTIHLHRFRDKLHSH